MRIRPLLCGLLLAVTGTPRLFAPPLPAAHSPETLLSADDQLLALGRQLPGFGGLFLDDGGRVNVYLVDPRAHGTLARKALGAGSRLLRADFRFADLLGWRYSLRPLLGRDGVTMLDVDETRNRVLLGVDPTLSAGGRAELVARVAAGGIPAAAVLVEEQPAFTPLPAALNGAPAAKAFPSFTTLDAKFRPAPGGVQIVFSGRFVCTLGFNAHLGRDFGFVVNQHCTAVRGEADGTIYSQGVPAAGTIGSEIRDPGFLVDGACPAERRCRFSDSAFARYSKKSFGKLAQIARPTAGDPLLGSLRVAPPTARFGIVGKASDPLFGQTAHKVGRTTGWTFGDVVGTCVDTNISGSDISMLCQTFVAGGGGPGDSGSPVFGRVGAKQARLMGILWGGGSSPTLGELFVFSPLSAIERELGTLKVH
jgi:hypothetical protein